MRGSVQVSEGWLSTDDLRQTRMCKEPSTPRNKKKEEIMIDKTDSKQRAEASNRHWGIWYLSTTAPLSLNLYPYPNNSPYEIELTRLDNPNKILSWINHLIESKEDWLEIDDVRDLLKACHELIQDGLILMPRVYRQGPAAMSRWGY